MIEKNCMDSRASKRGRLPAVPAKQQAASVCETHAMSSVPTQCVKWHTQALAVALSRDGHACISIAVATPENHSSAPRRRPLAATWKGVASHLPFSCRAEITQSQSALHEEQNESAQTGTITLAPTAVSALKSHVRARKMTQGSCSITVLG